MNVLSLTSRCDMFGSQPKIELSLKLFTHHKAIMLQRHVSTAYRESLNEAIKSSLCGNLVRPSVSDLLSD